MTKPSTTEMNQAWSALRSHFRCDGAEVNGFEVWQWMGVFDGWHEFRHRSHPVHGRIVWRTPVVR